MDERKKQVLHAIITDYVATAEPVGSRTISKKYGLGVSSATIRNEMSDLEELGYIEQPHTSAGRIPSDKGYRYYVDCLMEKEQLTPGEMNSVTQVFGRKLTELDHIVQATCQLMSQLTNYTAIILVPKRGEGTLERIQLIPVSLFRVMVVIVSDTGFINHRVMDLTKPVDLQQLQDINNFLQGKLFGLNMEQVNLTLLQEITHQLNHHEQLKNLAFELMEQVLLESGEERVFLGGALNMFNQPEFRDVEKLKTLLSSLEEDQVVKSLLKKEGRDGTEISIGGENAYQGVKQCSVITTDYKVGGKTVGSIGVLGPTRMNYSKAVALVEFVTDQLSHILEKMAKR
ncbi:heat-inducible transcriptional repressor HrcA [Candidatus Formimonas warabiya]|uniref:Heat-inducible transcription repressor HrcA n=1 Tax=Formimonas warabiya TaxID=1761012 RepID=A0A3G1KSE1_FORW1|nr:heat-inducible transcriptional repressor HrcA [Candidatus Formimonas warabiya]ATW25356.1 heat-inducible transcription repressor HrcA [Candidatus Formimonas warabiya]